MSRFVIEGGSPIGGDFEPAGNKNAALPMLAACLLSDQPITLKRVPDIQDVRVLCEVIHSLGASVTWEGSEVTVHAADLDPDRMDMEACRRIRGSILLAGPLLDRCGRVRLASPGGDVIGRRRLDSHIHGLEAMGATLEWAHDGFTLTANELHGADCLLDEASVTATENLVMAAAAIAEETVLYNAACEPHVQDVCRMVVAMGAEIDGIGTNRLVIRGSQALQTCSHEVGADYIEAGSFLAAAAMTGGELRVCNVHEPNIHRVLHRGFSRLGVSWQVDGADWLLNPETAHLRVSEDLGGAIPKIEDGIWPAFPSDLMSILLVLATQANGNVLFFEKLFESRMVWVDRLISMGARIVQCDPHRVIVHGPSALYGSHQTSPDIRAGMALILAALSAEGTSVIDNAQMIDRGYERVDVRLRHLGAKIEREV